jgi:hypothetical protein
MTLTRNSGLVTRARLMAVAMLVLFAAVAMQPAQAQTPSDTWKSVAIIGGSTAAGAYIGHKIAGPTGTWIGAGAGAAVGYAIDRRRRQNEYNNQYGYAYPGSYDPNSGYYGNGGYYPSAGNYPNGGYYPNAGAYPGGYGYQGNSYATTQRYSRRPR